MVIIVVAGDVVVIVVVVLMIKDHFIATGLVIIVNKRRDVESSLLRGRQSGPRSMVIHCQGL